MKMLAFPIPWELLAYQRYIVLMQSSPKGQHLEHTEQCTLPAQGVSQRISTHHK